MSIGLPQCHERLLENRKSQKEFIPHESVVKEVIIKPPTQNPGKETVKSDGDSNHLFYIYRILNVLNLRGR
jgi:hypothetical protein